LYSFVILASVDVRKNIYGLIQTFFKNTPYWCNITVMIIIIIAFVSFLFSVYHLLSTMKPRTFDKAFDHGKLDDTQRKMWRVALNNNKKILDITLDDYYNTIKDVGEDDIIKFEGLELLRLNFIRAKKIEHYDDGLRYLESFLVSVLLIGFMIFLNKFVVI